MRLLFLCSQPPHPATNGAAQRLFHHVRALAERHEVTLAYVQGSGSHHPQLDTGCARVLELPTRARRISHNRVGLPATVRLHDLFGSARPAEIQEWRAPDIIEAIERDLSRQAFDFTWIERAYVASAARSVGILANVLDMDDVDSDAFVRRVRSLGWYKSRPIDELEAVKLRAYEWQLTRVYRAIAVCKEQDRRFFCHPQRVHVLPNGAELPTPQGDDPHRDLDLLFVGNMSYWPNADAAAWFAQDVLPLIRREHPLCMFGVAGRQASSFAERLTDTPNCTVISDPPSLAPVYARAKVVVVPMRQGSGTSVKTLEALAYRKAVVATPIVADGLGLIHGEHALIASDASDFASMCCRLLEDSALASSLGVVGRSHVAERFSWERCAKGAVDLVDTVRRTQLGVVAK